MFNGQSNSIFGSATNTGLFGQTQNQSSLFGSTTNNINGTTVKYAPLSGTDSIQKNGQTISVQTKLNCVSAMKEYETKSLDELRFEDYNASRIYPQKTVTGGFFGATQPTTAMFNNQSMFQTNATPFGSNASANLSGSTTKSLFGNSNPTNSFGSNNLFGVGSGTPTSTTSAFGSLNNQSKTQPLFGMNNTTVNKPLFGSPQSTQSTSLFGASQQSSTPSLFGNTQPAQSTGFFGGMGAQSQQQQMQSTGLFNSNTSTASFGFQTQPSTGGLFGNTNNTLKPFGAATNGSFSFTNTSPQTSTGLFGNTGVSTSGGLFSQNSSNPVFGSTPKQSLFNNQSTFNTPVSNQTQNLFPQTAGTFGQTTTNMFNTNQPKPAQPFGSTSVFNSASKPSIFGTNTNTTTGFGAQPSSLFNTFGASSQPFGSTITTSAVSSINNSFPIGATTPAEAVFQQQMIQQKILSLVENRPYGINPLFMGHKLKTNEVVKSSVSEAGSNSTNLLSLAIKRNDLDQSNQRRRILNPKTKIQTNNFYKAFTGFDEDEDSSSKFNDVDNFFFTKREDWKYLPPTAFAKCRKSLNYSTDNSLTESPKPFHGEVSIQNRSLIHEINSLGSNQAIKENSNIGSISFKDSSFNKSENAQTFFGHNGRDSPIPKISTSKRDSFVNNNSNAGDCAVISKPSDLKEESMMKSVDDSLSEIKNQDTIPNKTDKSFEPIESVGESHSCSVKLTKDGYYTAPKFDVLDTLVQINEFGEKECWVENLIIGRKNFGSIRFPGFTDVYGLNLDELVSINNKEVSVYPDDENKHDVGEGLNKLAQVCLNQVWPNDKSNGEIIKDQQRLVAMGYEERLKNVTARMDAKFISYSPGTGIWIFEVKHFSKYGLLDSDEDDIVAMQDLRKDQTDNSKTEFKKELNVKPLELVKRIHEDVVMAEADSLTNMADENLHFIQRSAFDKLIGSSHSRNVFKMKQSFYNYDSDEEIHDISGLIGGSLKYSKNNTINKLEEYRDITEQPKSKKFETCAMGEQIFKASKNDTSLEIMQNQLMPWADNNDKRPIKSCSQISVAPTTNVISKHGKSQKLCIPGHLRDLRSIKMPYLFSKFVNYFDSITPDTYKKYTSNVALMQGNRFRVGFHISGKPNSSGINFFKINSTEDFCSSFGTMYKKTCVPNSLMVMKCNYSVSNFQKQLMDSALSVCQFAIDPETKCPLWTPPMNLEVLNCYLKVNNEMNCSSLEHSVFQRIILLCSALWSKLGDDKDVPSHMHDLGRKQLFSKWIKMECRDKLVTQLKSALKPAGYDNIDKINDCILNALCSGEINLACQLAIMTKQHRLSLLIAQAANDLQGREVIREQLSLWLQSRADEHIPFNIMCIYVVLSGQTSTHRFNGTVISPLREMSWVQALGAHFWYTQSYLGSIKSATDAYEDSFKTETDIPCPYPIDSQELTCATEGYAYYDCCYHLIKLYCNKLYDIDVLLNPPTMSKDNIHKLAWDWAASWHIANFLTSMGYCKNIPSKISMEWAAQLERGGLWKMAAFVILHIPELRTRMALMKNLINRHVVETKAFNEDEEFLVNRLHVPCEWIYEGKAIRCKATDNVELEAFHWFKANKLDMSHSLYVDSIIPQLLINDKFDKIKEILQLFVGTGADKSLPNWPVGGELYLKYVHIVSTLRVMKLTNKLANHSFLMNGDLEIKQLIVGKDDIPEAMQKLKIEMLKMFKAVQEYKINNDAQRICKNQIVTMCNSFLQACSTEIF